MAGVLLPGSARGGGGDIEGVTAGDGLSGGGSSGSVTVTLDLNELTAAAVADGDFIAIIDANDSNASRKEAVADLATLFAGTGLTASSSVISVDDSTASAKGAVIVAGGDGAAVSYSSGTATVAVDLGTNPGLEIASNKLQIAKGISQHDVAQFAAGVVDDDFLRVDGTTIEGRSASEVLSDIGGQATLTFGISNTNAVKVDSASVADDEYARFTADGLESRSTSEVLSDISAAPAAGSANILTTGALDSGSITSGFGAIDNGTSNIRTATFTAETAVVPDAASGATLGTTSLEWGHLYIGDDQKIYLGDGQDVSLEYDEDGTDQLRIAGGTVFENAVDFTLDAHFDSSPADETVSGITATFTAGEDLVRGEVVYFKASDSKMHKAVATAAGTMPAVAMAAADVSADATAKFLLFGFLQDNGTFPAYTVGGTIYAPEAETSSQNVPEQTAPDSDGDFVQVLGYAVTANAVFFNPSNDVIEHA